MARTTSKRSSKGGFKDAWNKTREKAKEEAGDFNDELIPVPVGNYGGQLVRVNLITDKNDNSNLIRNWCVVNHDEHSGAILTEFSGDLEDPERMVWIQRQLNSLGVDLEEAEVEKPEDIEDIYNELIENSVCAKIRVYQNGEYINMRTGKEASVDDDDLVDPDEAMKGRATSSSDDSEEETEEADFAEGDKVSFKQGKKTLEGIIEEFTEDDEAVVKVGRKEYTKSLDDLELLESGDEEEEAEEDELDDEEEEAEEENKLNYDVGDEITIDYEGEEYEGKVTAIEDGVIYADFGDGEEEVSPDSIIESEEEEEGEDEEEGESELEFEAGDEVSFKQGRKTLEGEIRSIDEEEEIAKVKVDGERKLFEVPFAKLSHAVAG